jgi:hypothetical protein
MCVPACEVGRHIGISGKFLVKALGRARGRHFDEATIGRLEERHEALLFEYSPCRCLCQELLTY